MGERNAARGLRVVGVTKHAEDAAERADVERVAKERGMTAPSYLDSTGDWCKAAGVRLEPTFVLLDKAGKVAYRHAGKLVEGSEPFEKINELVAKM